MIESQTVLIVTAAVICTAISVVYWIGVWDKKTGWSKDVER